MTEYHQILNTQPVSEQFSDIDNPEYHSQQPIHQQIIHRTKVTVIKDKEDSLPKGCQIKVSKRAIPTKNILHYKRQRYYTLSNVDKIEQDNQQEYTTQRQEHKRRQEEQKTPKQNFVQEMKQINKNYCQFMKQFKKTKPLYILKQEQFKVSEKVTFELKREQVLRKLKQHYKPISFEEIDQHQKSYLRKKTIERQKMHSERNQGQRNNESIQSLRNSPPKIRYLRGKSSTICIQDMKSDQYQSKQIESQSLSKMRDHYDSIINKSKVSTKNSHLLKRKLSVRVEPSTAQSSPTLNKKQFNRAHHRSLNYQSIQQPESNQFTSLYLNSSTSPKHTRKKRLSFRKNYSNQVILIQPKDQNQQKANQDYYLARFGKQSCQNDSYKRAINQNDID